MRELIIVVTLAVLCTQAAAGHYNAIEYHCDGFTKDKGPEDFVIVDGVHLKGPLTIKSCDGTVIHLELGPGAEITIPNEEAPK